MIRTDRVEWAEAHFAAVLRGLGYKVRVDELPGTTYRIRWGEVPDPIIEEIFELSSDTLSVDIESFDQWAEDDTLDREIRIEIPPEFEP